MKTALIVAAALSVLTATARAQGEGNGDPFPFGAAPIATSRTSAFADTGSAAYPDFVGHPGRRLALRGVVLPFTGGEGAVQTAGSLPKGFTDGTAATMQAEAAARSFARLQLRRGLTPQSDADRHG